MNSKSDLTLANIKKSPKLGRVHRTSDYLTKEDKEDLMQSNFRGKRSKRKFNDIDALAAEILARFGWEAYQAWNNFEIPHEDMNRYLEAERAREKAQGLALKAIIVQMVGSCIKREKNQPQPKGPKQAQKIMKEEVKSAKGE